MPVVTRPGASPVTMFSVGGICGTTIYRVPEIHAPPSKLIADRMAYVVDGMALSAAFAFRKLGGEAIICGRLGDDPEGVAMRSSLEAEGFDTSAIRTVDGSVSSHVAVTVDGRGERVVIVYHDPRTNTSAGWLPTDEIAKATILHCDVRWPEGAKAALIAARDLGVRSMLDGDVAPRELLAELVPLADYAVFSDAGIFRYTGADNVEDALRQAGAHHAGHVGATCGKDGYFWIEGGEIRNVSAPAVEVVDTLSAGDIFHGAFALAIVEGKDISEAASFGCTAASLKCSRFGGRLGCPSRSEVDLALGRQL